MFIMSQKLTAFPKNSDKGLLFPDQSNLKEI